MTNQRIIIIGFMGSGKTTVAQTLGRTLNCSAVDLDDVITKHEGRSPNELIEQEGENRFREIETQQLRLVLQAMPAGIIAVGGGAWTIAANRTLIADRGAIAVWLDAPFELCWKRIATGSEARPLAPSREMAEQLYAERRPIYELAGARIPVSADESAAEVATKISNAILSGRQRS